MTYAIPTIIILAWTVPVAFLLRDILTAPIGYEDSEGFHAGTDPYLSEAVRRAIHSQEGIYYGDDPHLSQIINGKD